MYLETVCLSQCYSCCSCVVIISIPLSNHLFIYPPLYSTPHLSLAQWLFGFNLTSTVIFVAFAKSGSLLSNGVDFKTLYCKSASPFVFQFLSCSSKASHLTMHFHSRCCFKNLSFSCKVMSSRSVMGGTPFLGVIRG